MRDAAKILTAFGVGPGMGIGKPFRMFRVSGFMEAGCKAYNRRIKN